jgi:hypothetical protein
MVILKSTSESFESKQSAGTETNPFRARLLAVVLSDSLRFVSAALSLSQLKAKRAASKK